MDLIKAREEFIKYIKKELIGYGDESLFYEGVNPFERFVSGFLFPLSQDDSYFETDEDESTNSLEEENATSKSSIKRKRHYYPPSSAGFSFFISGQDIEIRVYFSAVKYKKLDKTRNEKGQFINHKWEKIRLETSELILSPQNQGEHVALNNEAKIISVFRAYNDGYIVSLSIVNANKMQKQKDKVQECELSLFEVQMGAIAQSGVIGEYPKFNDFLLDEEQKELELRYQDSKCYAIGHGCALDWSDDGQEIFLDFMPCVQVAQTSADTSDDEILSFKLLKDENAFKSGDNFALLEGFVAKYAKWIKQEEQNSQNEADKNTANNIIAKLKDANLRIQDGIRLLKQDEMALKAFCVMNEAMLMQWITNDKFDGKTKDEISYKWRAFQLGFILTTMKSVIDENDRARDVLDLIWFATGGGKTEAYLGVMLFLFVYRRLRYKASYGGTACIMRYTYKLLTLQQFLRANRAVLALELLRRQNPALLGDEPFSAGLWIGQSSSANSLQEVDDALSKKEYDRLVLRTCPWCKQSFSERNYIRYNQRFHFACHNPLCDFGKTGDKLPLNVVDDELYKNPPTLLLATVDKFARLAWESRADAFFGRNSRPPELIIQDELHLIASSLGSIVGLYEAGLESAIISRGVHPKYIASTATIKNASKQIKELFAKDMALFPPSGLRSSDSYFAKQIPLDKKPGRLYVGYLAPLFDKRHSLEPLASALLLARLELFSEYERDLWWSSIIYHSSLKSLGNSDTLYKGAIKYRYDNLCASKLRIAINKEIPGYCDDKNLQKMQDFLAIKDPQIKSIVDAYVQKDLNIKSLSSKSTDLENKEYFEKLSLSYGDNECVDVALATNMISVGLDVSRLALMVIMGQPLTTAEYIQASSRVGRGDTPGIVFTNYYKTQARSISHYENFKAYHNSFYKYVEPTSITPFTYQARLRALHASLIIALRFANVGLLDNKDAKNFDINKPEISKALANYKNRIKACVKDEYELKKIYKHIDELLKLWQLKANEQVQLHYYSKDGAYNSLLVKFGQEHKVGWKTLDSMRNVEDLAVACAYTGVFNGQNL